MSRPLGTYDSELLYRLRVVLIDIEQHVEALPNSQLSKAIYKLTKLSPKHLMRLVVDKIDSVGSTLEG